jgi:5-(carboxyamino)imidazole ribonucleotide synthase
MDILRGMPTPGQTEPVIAPLPATGSSAPLAPGSTIGILGGGQLGRMLAMAARRLGYRIISLDPDPHAPAGGVSDELVVAGYDDQPAAIRLAERCDVVTYELEHLDADLAEAVSWRAPLRPNVRALRVTQDRLQERRFVAGLGIPVAPWREVATVDDARSAASTLGYPLRLKRTRGGYDGRGQWRIVDAQGLERAWSAVDDQGPMLLERELDFVTELSVVCCRGVDGRAVTFPVANNVHDDGILVASSAPAPLARATLAAAREIATRVAEALDIIGTVTVELFLLQDDTLAVNELAPRVHNSGHYTADACVTSQFEQHIRAICGLPLGDVGMHGSAATINVLGTGPRRPARLTGLEAALEDPLARVHIYDKREVFQRRKMGHVTVVSAEAEDAVERARRAAAKLGWAP